MISGTMFTARDAAHKRIVETIQRGENPPFDLKGQIIYYMGPSPARPGKSIGAAGPTTSGRMDIYTPYLIEHGLKCMIGKGSRSQAVKQSLIKNKAIYFAALGGAGALISKCIKNAEIIAYEDLGAEAVRKIEVLNFPVIVINDIHGNDLYTDGKKQYNKL